MEYHILRHEIGSTDGLGAKVGSCLREQRSQARNPRMPEILRASFSPPAIVSAIQLWLAFWAM